MKLLPQYKPLLTPIRYKGTKGGRASGKSHFFAECVVKLCVTYQKFNVVCIREIQKSLKFSAKKLIEDKIAENGYSNRFVITQNEIRGDNGSLIIFQGMQDHTAESIKSLEGFDVAWVEEAQSISSRSLELLIPTIRTENSELWFSWNPTYEDDPIEVFFKELNKTNSILVHSNYDTNKLLPSTITDEAERHKKANPETYIHIWLGDYKTSEAGSVYKFDRNIHSTNREMLPKEPLIIGQDFNIGGCVSIVYVREGDNMFAVDEFISKDTFELRDNLLEKYQGHQIEIIPDASGRSNKTNASRSDIGILQDAGFRVNAPKKNPRIEDRINATNDKYIDGTLFINTTKCPKFTKAQIKQVYDENSAPEKFTGAGTIDDYNDAGTYPIHRLFGLSKTKVNNISLSFG